MSLGKSQGSCFTVFLIGLTIACAGLADVASGIGKLALAVGIVLAIVSFVYAFKLKPLSGKPAENAQPTGLKLAGVVAALLGWLVALVGIHLIASVPGRMVVVLVGLAVSLSGVLYFLPKASSQNAIWKA